MKESIEIYCKSLNNVFYLNQLDGFNRRNTYQEVFASRYIINLSKGNKFFIYSFLVFTLLIYPFICVKSFFESIVYLFKHKSSNIKEGKLFLFSNIALTRVASNAGLTEGVIARLYSEPLWKTPDEKYTKYSIYNLLKLRDAFSILWDSIKTYYIVCKNFGLCRCYSAIGCYSWFLDYYAARYIPSDVELFYCDHKNGTAIIIDNLPNRKNLVQHGTEIIIHNTTGVADPYYKYLENSRIWTQNIPCKQKQVDKIYAFSDKEACAMVNAVLNCSPSISIVGYGTKLCKIEHTRPSVLVICYYSHYYDIEKKIVECLQGLSIDLYLKNHPLFSASYYDDLLNNYQFKLINGSFFPDVDLVISYDSTLALEYQALGKDVLFYDDVDIINVRSIISEKLQLSEY